jgi:hypothetical protein
MPKDIYIRRPSLTRGKYPRKLGAPVFGKTPESIFCDDCGQQVIRQTQRMLFE